MAKGTIKRRHGYLRVATGIRKGSLFKLAPTTGDNTAIDQAALDSAFKKAELRQVTARCIVVGLPWLTAGQTIKLHGVGRRWEGLWYITQCDHQIDMSGYVCNLMLSRNAVNYGGTGPAGGTPNTNTQVNPGGSQAPKTPAQAPTVPGVSISAVSGQVSGG